LPVQREATNAARGRGKAIRNPVFARRFCNQPFQFTTVSK
jgi:hypothetical protein